MFMTQNHGIGHFLSACIIYRKLASLCGMRFTVYIGAHSLSKAFELKAWPPTDGDWCRKNQDILFKSVVGNISQRGSKLFERDFLKHCVRIGVDNVLAVGGPDMSCAIVHDNMPDVSFDFVRAFLATADRRILKEVRDVLRHSQQILHIRLGDAMAFGFKNQREDRPVDEQFVIRHCKRIVQDTKERLGICSSKPLIILSDSTQLLSALQAAKDPHIIVANNKIHHCAIANSQKGVFDPLIRDCLMLCGSSYIEQRSVYDHGSMLVRVMGGAGGSKVIAKPLFAKTHIRCQGRRQDGKRCSKKCLLYIARDGEQGVLSREGWWCDVHSRSACPSAR